MDWRPPEGPSSLSDCSAVVKSVFKAFDKCIFLSSSPQPTCGNLSLFFLAIPIPCCWSPCLSVIFFFFVLQPAVLPYLPANISLQLLLRLISHLPIFTSTTPISPTLGSLPFARLPFLPPSTCFFYPSIPSSVPGHASSSTLLGPTGKWFFSPTRDTVGSLLLCCLPPNKLLENAWRSSFTPQGFITRPNLGGHSY